MVQISSADEPKKDTLPFTVEVQRTTDGDTSSKVGLAGHVRHGQKCLIIGSLTHLIGKPIGNTYIL